MQIGHMIDEHRPESLIIVGDLTEEKDFHSAALVNDVVDLVYSFSEMVEEVTILLGNHDYTRADCPFFHFLRRLPKVRWVTKPSYLPVVGLGSCLFLPHTHHFDRDWEGFLPGSCNPMWTFAHNTFAGAETEHGKRLGGIPTSIFPRGMKVVSGDIHTPQVIGPVTYVGAPYTVDFGDDYEARLLWLSGPQMTSFPLPGPQKRLLDLSKGYKAADLNADTGDIVKVRYTLTNAERDRWFEIKQVLRDQLSDKGCIVHTVQPLLDKTPGLKVVAPKVQNKSDEQVTREYGKATKMTEPFLAAGVELLSEA